jgi:hypothetical protein
VGYSVDFVADWVAGCLVVLARDLMEGDCSVVLALEVLERGLFCH